jgi:hypothetical protein
VQKRSRCLHYVAMPDNGDAKVRDETASSQVRRINADGFLWTVSEVPAPQFDRRSGTHLRFDAEVVMRRVRDFPANWFELSDEELYALTDRP